MLKADFSNVRKSVKNVVDKGNFVVVVWEGNVAVVAAVAGGVTAMVDAVAVVIDIAVEVIVVATAEATVGSEEREGQDQVVEVGIHVTGNPGRGHTLDALNQDPGGHDQGRILGGRGHDLDLHREGSLGVPDQGVTPDGIAQDPIQDTDHTADHLLNLLIMKTVLILQLISELLAGTLV